MKSFYRLFTVVVLTFVLIQIGYAQSPKMNEVYSRGVAGNLDWIEIYNPSTASMDISGYKIYDNGGQAGTKPKKLFPAGTIIPASGFTVIITDTADFVGDLSGFGISSGGETVWLEDATGLLIDSVVIPALGVDTSFARIPDGSDFFTKTTPLTKGTSNVLIKMNEIYSRGVAGNLDWIEIYNSSASSIDISGYKIYDSGGQSGSKPKKLLPAGTILPSNGFYVVITDTADFAGDLSSFGLSSGGEIVWLEDALGLLIDTVAIPALGVDTSYARVPDGSGVFVKLSPTTRGVSNEFVIPVELISFSASLSENSVNLSWATATETNNKGFEIQKKFNDGVFEVIGFVQGSGTTTEKQNYSFIDKNLNVGNYQYRLKQVDYDGSYSYSHVIEIEYSVIPQENQLAQNYPNPFNPSTVISYQISSNSMVTLKIYNALGKEVVTLVNENQAAGSYSISFTTSKLQLASGTYFYELRAGDFVSVKKMLLLK